MRYSALAIVSAACASLLVSPASAATCANGVYRAGCAGPNGAAVARKPPTYYHAPPAYYHAPAPRASCAKGAYRAGCVGPNGAAVVRTPN
jgi:hypothetical protein